MTCVVFICKGLCTSPIYKHKKTVRDIKNTPYKKCSKCSVCMVYDGLFCPCCRCRLSTRQKARQSRAKANRTMSVLEIAKQIKDEEKAQH